jgi:hypothetical protein
LERSLQ